MLPGRTASLEEIQQIGFEIDDLTLYLDTHPLDTEALDAFEKARKKRYDLMKDFARDFEPLNLYLVEPKKNNASGSYCKYPGQEHFTWSDGPLPWDSQGGL